MGFQVTSFVTILGTAGVTVGLALQGSLSNLAGGILILMLKPFKVGDYILENNTGCEGTVTAIDIFYTKLITVDGKSIVIPNGNISNTSLVNYSANPIRRVDISFLVGYEENLDKVKKVTLDAVKGVPGYRGNEPVDFFIEDFGDSGIKLFIRFYVDSSDYFNAKWDARWNIKKSFDQQGIVIPYNQLDVNLKQ
jgi:small conductance mechanosensitive channel